MATYSDPTIVQLGEKSKTQTGTTLTLIAGVIAIVGMGAFFAQVYLTKKAITDTQSKITAATAERAKYEATAKDLVYLDQTSQNLHSIFDNQKQWDKVLGTVEQRLYRNMAVTNLNFNDKGELAMAGYLNSFEDYAKMISSLTDTNGQLYLSVLKPTSVTKINLAPNTKPLPGTPPDGTVSFAFTSTLTPRVLAATDTLTLAELLTGGKN